MPALNNGKHIIGEIGGVRCTIIENDATDERVNFLKDLLEANNFEVKVEANKAEDPVVKTYTIGVTNLLFHPVIAIYERSIRTRDGRIVTPAYWLQLTDRMDRRYWRVGYGSQAVNNA